MKPCCPFRLGLNPWTNGLLLALLNLVLAVFSIGSFIGVLSVVSWLNQLRFANDRTSAELPFPFPVLMLLYAILFAVAWVCFGRRLPNVRRERVIATLVGAGPLFGLGVSGYAGVIGGLVIDELAPGIIPVGSFFVFGGISTLVLFAGLTCVGMVMLTRGNVDHGNPGNPVLPSI